MIGSESNFDNGSLVSLPVLRLDDSGLPPHIFFVKNVNNIALQNIHTPCFLLRVRSKRPDVLRCSLVLEGSNAHIILKLDFDVGRGFGLTGSLHNEHEVRI